MVRIKRLALAGAALAICAVTSTSALAGQTYQFSSDTGRGLVTSFDWNGGDQGNLEGVMQFAAERRGNFSGVDFRRNQVNMFLVDFSESGGRYANLGVTLFVMWGNERAVNGGRFSGEVDISPPMTEDADDGSYSSRPHIFALGEGVEIDDRGPLTVDVDVRNSETPVGFAISNLLALEGFGQRSRVNLQFTLAEAISALRLLGFGQGKVWQGVDDDDDDNIFTDGVVLVIPAPPAGVLGIAGLSGLALVGRRRR